MNSRRKRANNPRARVVLAVVAQGANSLSNLTLTVLIARATGVAEFAAFALTIPSYVVAQRFWRVFILIPHQVEINRNNRDVLATFGAPVFRTAGVALTFSLFTLAAASLVGGQYLSWGALLALSLPPIAAYDAVRNTAFASERMMTVATMDLAWLSLQLIGSAFVVFNSWSTAWLAIAWLLPPAFIAISKFPDWNVYRQQRRTNNARMKGRLADAVTDLFSSTLVAQLIPYVIAVLATASIAGAFRGAQTLTGPVNILIMGLMPLLQNLTARSSRKLNRVVRLTAYAVLSFTGGAALYAGALILIPDFIGDQLLGATWRLTAPLLPGVALLMCLRTPFITIITSLRSLGRVRQIVKLRTLYAVALLTTATLTAALAPATWIAPSMAIASAAIASMAWTRLTRPDLVPTERLPQ